MVRGARQGLTSLSLAAALAILAGCGGGGGGGGAASAIPPGAADSSYGVGGKFTAPTTTAAFGMAVGPDGSVVLTGNSGIFKVDPSGVGVEPLASGQFGSVPTRAPVVDPSGHIYFIAGSYPTWLGVYALDSAGHLAAFGMNGLAALPSLGGPADNLNDVVRDADGNVYVVGTRGLGFGGVIVAAKFDPSGRLATSYGANGFAAVATGAVAAAANSAAIDAAENLLIAGSAGQRAFVAKLDREGRLVPGFGNAGLWLESQCTEVSSMASAVVSDSSGSVYVAGRCGSHPAVFKLDASGSLVASFRGSGLRGGLFGADEGNFSDANAVLGAPGGAIYVGGSVTRPNTSCRDLAVTKLDSGGDAIVSFGDGGVTRLGVPNGTLTDLGLDAQGRLYAGGISNACTSGTMLGYSVFRIGG